MTQARTTRPRAPELLAVLVGGAVGGLLRWGTGTLVPDGGGWPLTTLGVNVVGSFVLALLPAMAPVRRRRWLTVGLGPGVLGGFTTLSAASEQTRALLTSAPLLGLGYATGTLATCVLAVALASALSTFAEQAEVADEGGDE